jgi:hypothetical protein
MDVVTHFEMKILSTGGTLRQAVEISTNEG